MGSKLTIAVIEGSARDKRRSIHAARFVAGIAASYPHTEVLFVDPKDFSFPNDGNDTEGRDPAYTDITARADAFYLVVPEYNHSFPGSLKRMLDSEYENYWHKPVALAGVSNGGWGGVRAVEGLLPALRTMGLTPLQFSTYFPRVQDIFDEDGSIQAEHERAYTRRVRAELDELIWLAQALKWGREHLGVPGLQ